eukprot:scaffold34833_cov194-Isochrysis_galbana.AAC.1
MHGAVAVSAEPRCAPPRARCCCVVCPTHLFDLAHLLWLQMPCLRVRVVAVHVCRGCDDTPPPRPRRAKEGARRQVRDACRSVMLFEQQQPAPLRLRFIRARHYHYPKHHCQRWLASVTCSLGDHVAVTQGEKAVTRRLPRHRVRVLGGAEGARSLAHKHAGDFVRSRQLGECSSKLALDLSSAQPTSRLAQPLDLASPRHDGGSCIAHKSKIAVVHSEDEAINRMSPHQGAPPELVALVDKLDAGAIDQPLRQLLWRALLLSHAAGRPGLNNGRRALAVFVFLAAAIGAFALLHLLLSWRLVVDGRRLLRFFFRTTVAPCLGSAASIHAARRAAGAPPPQRGRCWGG